MMKQYFSGNAWLTMLGDWLVLLLLVVAGQQEHDLGGTAARTTLLITTLSLAVPWTITAVLFSLYRLDATWTWPQWFGRVVAAWLIAAPLGVSARSLLLGRSTIIVIFMIVITGLGGLIMLVWRGLVRWWGLRAFGGEEAARQT